MIRLRPLPGACAGLSPTSSIGALDILLGAGERWDFGSGKLSSSSGSGSTVGVIAGLFDFETLATGSRGLVRGLRRCVAATLTTWTTDSSDVSGKSYEFFATERGDRRGALS